ncbi:MAG: Hsp20/alpha crystallin family protein [Candidatus Thorarchaeota archaeon]
MTENNKRLVWVHPCIDCGCDCEDIENDHYHITLELPGVKKENINLQIIKSGLRLKALKNENTEYISELKFLCDAKIDAVKAKYEDGLLSVDIPFDCPDPFTDVKPTNIA